MTKGGSGFDDDGELDQLLARGRLSGAQYDAIERRVLERSAPKRSARFWPVLAAAAFMLVGASALLFGRGDGTVTEDGFRSKGAGSDGAALLDVGCRGERPKVCRLGDTLMFSTSHVDREGHLAAYAEPEDAPGAPRIWYFPTADGGAPHVAASADTLVLSQGVRLGPPHRKGKYRVTLWIADAPVQREQAAGGAPPGARSVVIEIVD